MKKIITLLLALGLFTTSFAQYNHAQNEDGWNKRNDQYATSNDQYDRHWNDHGFYDKGNNFSARERDFQVDRINRDFAFKIERIKNDPYMSRREKKFSIRDARNERAKQILWVNERFNSQFNNGYEKHGHDRW